MAPDNELLARWLRTRSEQDFAELVQRHLAMVHSAALRVVNGDRHLADDVTQTVFADLARKARGLRDRPSLAGWLHTSARFAAMGLLRGEHRRRQREQEALSMPSDTDAEVPAWSELQPVIDAAVGDLSAKDREALLLRYFENRSHREIGEILGLTDNAARMRVERALEKVRGLLAKRGVISPASGLAAALLAHGTLATTTVTAAQLTATALTATAAGPGFTLLHLMTATQLKTGLAVTAVVAGLTMPIIVQHGTITDLKAENALLLPQIAALEAANTQLRGDTVDRAELDVLRLEVREALGLRAQVATFERENGRLTEIARKLESENAALLNEKQKKEESTARNIFRQDKGVHIGLVTQAILSIAKLNGGELPATMSDVENFLESDPKMENILHALRSKEREWGFSLDQYEIAWSGNLADIADPTQTVLLRDRSPSRTSSGFTLSAKSFANGSISLSDGSAIKMAPMRLEAAKEEE